MVKKCKNICLVKHKSAKSLVIFYFRYSHPRLSEEKLLDSWTDFKILKNETKRYENARVKDILNTVKKLGIWACCYHNKKKKVEEIHYWIWKSAKKEEIIEIFMHELIHSVGYSSEKIAVKFAGLARYAYRILIEDILGEKLDEFNHFRFSLKKIKM